MTVEDQEKIILANLESYPVTYSTLWRRCGSPQGEAGWHFDRAILSLRERGEIYSASSSAGMCYAAKRAAT